MQNKITDALWRSGNLSYKLHGNQLKLYSAMKDDTRPISCTLCARRWGKSFLAALVAVEEAIQNPGSKVILLAPDKAQAYDIYNSILKTISADAPEGFIRPTKSEAKWHVGASELVFAGFDTIAESLRGRGAVLIVIDEAGFTNPEEFEYVTKSILFPMLQKTIGKKRGRQIYLSTPAKLPEHPFNLFWEKEKEEGRLRIFTIYDNPILTSEDIQDIVNMYGGKDSPDFRREYLCENVRDKGGLIIPKFDDEHVMDVNKDISLQSNCWVSADVGGIRDKSVVLVFGRRQNDGCIIIIDEKVLEPNSEIVEIGEAINLLVKKHNVPKYQIWVDAHGQTLVDLHKICGISATLPPKQDRDGAIAALNSAFFRNELFVTSSCEFLIKSFKNCTFNENRTDFLRTESYGHADAIMASVYGFRVSQFVTPDIKMYSIDKIGRVKTNENLYEKITKFIKPVSHVFRK